MSLLFFDGFDHMGGSSTINGKWFNASFNTNATYPKTGTRCAAFSQIDFGGGIKLMPVPGDVFILGFAVRWETSASFMVNADFLRFQEGGTSHIGFQLNSSGYLVVNRGGTVIATATNFPLVYGSWWYLEFKVVIHDTLGSIAARVDTLPVTWNNSVTNIDTRNGQTGVVDRFQIAGNAQPPYTLVDDLYLCDDAGTINNDFLGVCVVENLMPQLANAGTHQDWTTSAGADHAAVVDEVPPTDDTDYLTSSTVGHVDTLNIPSLALTGAIVGVQTNLYARKTDVGGRTIAPVVKVGAAAPSVGTAFMPLTTYRQYPQLMELNPVTGVAWTSADIVDTQVGVKVVS